MRKSELGQSILAVLNSHPTKCFPLTAIAKELGKNIERESPFRASLSRCLNRLYREGLVDYEYEDLFPNLHEAQPTPNKHAGKYWMINSEHGKGRHTGEVIELALERYLERREKVKV